MASKPARPTVFDVRDHMVKNRERYAVLGPVAMHVFEVITLHTLYAPNQADQYGWVIADASKVSFLADHTAWSQSKIREALKDLAQAGLINHIHDPFSRKPGRGNPKRIRNNIAHHLLAERQAETSEG